jgi:hypothetical protein
VQTFAFWRYFDDADRVLSKNFTPTVLMIPNSTKALANYLQSDREDFYEQQKVDYKSKQLQESKQLLKRRQAPLLEQ